MRNNYAGKPIAPEDLSQEPPKNINRYNLLLKQEFTDINPVSAGEYQPRESRVSAGEILHIHTGDCTLLFHILGGSGTLFLDGRQIPVKEGDFFVVPLGARAWLSSQVGVGVPHRWVGFIGTLCREFEKFPVPFTLPPEVLLRLWEPDQNNRNLGSRLASDLFLIHSILRQPVEEAPDYIQKVVNRINTCYMEKLSVSQMAAELGLDRSHLSRLFKGKMNMSIQDYILAFRLGKARRYLKHGYSVTETAMLCGFRDRSNFTKVFIREIGCSPTEWVKILNRETWNRPR